MEAPTRIVFMAERSLWLRLRDLAFLRHCSIAELIRQAVIAWLAQQGDADAINDPGPRVA